MEENPNVIFTTECGDQEAPSEVDTVNIVDPNFLSSLIEQGVDANGSGFISAAEA